MTYFEASSTFEKAIQSKDVDAIRALLVGIIGADPTFATTEFQEALEYVKGRLNSTSIEEKYKRQSDEYKLENSEEWDEKYFQMNLVWLRDNFDIKDRLKHIKEVGKMAYLKRNTIGKSKIQQTNFKNNEEKKDRIVRTTVDEKQNNRLSEKEKGFNLSYILIGVGVIFALALIGITVYKFINR